MNDNKKLVLFDWGGVTDTGDLDNKYSYKRVMIDAFRSACKLQSSEYPDDKVWDMFQKVEYYELSHDAENKVQFEELLLQKLRKMYSAPISPYDMVEEFINYSISHFKYVQYYEDIIKFQYELADKCTVAIMSDLNWLDAHRLREQTDLSKFEYTFLSYERKASKRVGDLYRVVERETGFHGDEILLIDDMVINLNNARQLHWNIYQCSENDLVGIKGAVSSFLCYS